MCPCRSYVIVASVWFVAALRNWRDIYKLQYWIGAVLFVSMVETAMFYGWYEYSNYHGYACMCAAGGDRH